MDPLIALLLAFSLLFLGLIGGWLLGAKSGSAKGEGVVDSLRLQLNGVKEERDSTKSELLDMRRDLERARDERAELASRLAAAAAAQTERDRAQDDKITALQAFDDASKRALSDHFSSVGNRLLEDANKRFVELAEERLGARDKQSEARLQQLLTPVGDRLKAYEEQVGKIEKERTEAYGNLTGLIGEMKAGQEKVQTEAARLVNSLRNAPKARGRWGEQQLKNVLESCGLSEHVDFVTEASVTLEDGARQRPDAIIRTPGGRDLVVDAKVSLNAYQDAFEAGDEAGRDAAMSAHCRSMKTHIEGLSRKAYWDQFENAPDYVIMFVPGEHFLAAALEHDPQLWDYAFEKKVLLATPTNLVAIARTVAGVWRQEKMALEAKKIGALGKEMYDRLATAAEHLKRVGSGLNSAVGNYNKFVGSFERNVLSTGRKFAEMNIETGAKAIEELEPLEALPRYGEDEEMAALRLNAPLDAT